MRVACDANVRTTQAADKDGLPVALRVAFTGGAGKSHFEIFVLTQPYIE